jgi:hypothetical protein
MNDDSSDDPYPLSSLWSFVGGEISRNDRRFASSTIVANAFSWQSKKTCTACWNRVAILRDRRPDLYAALMTRDGQSRIG